MTDRSVELLYVDGCPHWPVVEERVLLALRLTQNPEVVRSRQVSTLAEADELGFRGSPTILMDGDDLFPDLQSPIGLSCRLYETTDRPSGAPTVDQVVAAIRARLS